MKDVYHVFIQQDGSDFLAYIPDINRMCEGQSLYDAINTARDLLCTYSLDAAAGAPSGYEEALAKTKEPADEDDFKYSEGLFQLIDIDFAEYKRRYENRKVKKNCTIPSWLNKKAEAAA